MRTKITEPPLLLYAFLLWQKFLWTQFGRADVLVVAGATIVMFGCRLVWKMMYLEPFERVVTGRHLIWRRFNT